MAIRTLFVTPFYEGSLGDDVLLAELAHSVRSFAAEDKAGQGWSKAHHYPGYTSYASLNDLPVRDPSFADLKRYLDRHAQAFAKLCHFDLGRKPKLDSLWVNLLRGGGGHSGHIHPHSIISGTLYVEVPDGTGALKLEDPRLARMMAAPSRLADAPEAFQSFIYAEPAPGTIFLWESWLRHEVPQSRTRAERISISFNYR